MEYLQFLLMKPLPKERERRKLKKINNIHHYFFQQSYLLLIWTKRCSFGDPKALTVLGVNFLGVSAAAEMSNSFKILDKIILACSTANLEPRHILGP